MKRGLLLGGAAGLVLVAASMGVAQRRGGFRGSPVQSLPQGNSDAEKKALAVLGEMQSGGETYLNVPVTDGRMMRLLTEAGGAKNVVEIGTSTGYSGIWLCMALQKTGGKLTTFEMDSGRASRARAAFERAGVGKLVTVVEGDAHQNIGRLKEPIDVLFIDADKEGYLDYFQKLAPLVRPGGLVLAHNVDSAGAYDRAVVADPAWETMFYMDGGGLGISLKKR